VSGLPASWITVPLCDLGTLRTGPFGSTLHQADYVDDGIPLVNPMHIVNARIEPSSKHCVSAATALRLADFRLAVGDVVIGRRGEMGRCAEVRGRETGWLCGTGSLIVRPNDALCPTYLQRFLSSDSVVAYLLGEAVGSTMSNLNQQMLLDLQVPLAPKREQVRIIDQIEELLSDLDAGVAELRAAQAKLKLYRQALLKAAVTGELTATWREGRRTKALARVETGAQLLARVAGERRLQWERQQIRRLAVQGRQPAGDWRSRYPVPVEADTSELPALPECWVWASLDMLGEIASGVAKGSKVEPGVALREVAYLRVANVQRGFLDLSEIKMIPATERDIADLTLQPGDLLFNEGGDRDKLGRGWVWRGEVKECIHQNHVFRMRPFVPEVLPELVSHHGNTFGKEWFQRAGKQTTNLASINMTMLRSFPVPVAPPEEQLAIREALSVCLSALDEQEAAVDVSLLQSEAQRKNILKAAFSGQLVPQDPNDEPASVLLERIRAERATRTAAPARRPRRAREPA